jgi:hypothetical protein
LVLAILLIQPINFSNSIQFESNCNPIRLLVSLPIEQRFAASKPIIVAIQCKSSQQQWTDELTLATARACPLPPKTPSIIYRLARG